ncbi:MAG: universal stress protein [Xanthobacteraceae bacterium]|nr:universal stress protein [Xanthobacteraceae bacterium]
MKDIIVKIEHDKQHDQALDFAISVAETFDAHVAGVSFGVLGGLPNYSLIGIPGTVLADLLAESEKDARTALERFRGLAGRSKLSFSEHLILDAEFGVGDAFASLARHYDLSIVRQSDDDGPDNELAIEAALFNTGRPTIVVPYIHQGGLKLDRVLCCWDGGAPAARAVNDALPLLKRAGTVEILNVTGPSEASKGEIHGVEIANHLARHDVKVEIETLAALGTGVADIILSHAADRAVDMIVMGGYGHSRLREFVLGGVTRDLLRSMTVPALMSR